MRNWSTGSASYAVIIVKWFLDLLSILLFGYVGVRRAAAVSTLVIRLRIHVGILVSSTNGIYEILSPRRRGIGKSPSSQRECLAAALAGHVT